MKTGRATVIGNGGFGTAVSLLLLENGYDVTLWGHDADYVEATREARENRKYLPGVPLPADLRLTADAAAAARDAALVVSAVPTRWLRSTMEGFRGLLPRRAPIVSLTKGIEEESLLRPSLVLRALHPGRPVAVLSGPSHAEEVARRVPTSVVVAASSRPLTRTLQKVFSTDRFRVYGNADPVGVELGGALKNVVAIAAGVVDGLGFGDNTKAALVTRGLVEIVRLAVKLGGRKHTFTGLAGVGDLITTSFSRHGRNRAVGERLGRGERLAAILGGMEMVAEGVFTARAVIALARRHRVDMPISREVHAMLFEDKDPAEALRSLMSRSSKSEAW